MILIIGSKEEVHSEYMFEALRKHGFRAVYFDSRKYPNDILLSYSPEIRDGSFVIEGVKIPFEEIKGIYWRWFYGVPYTETDNNFVSQMVYRERNSALRSLFLSLKTNWVNSYEAVELHKTKIHQLNILFDNNIRIPRTLVTNDKDELVDFYERNNKNIIYKPVLGGAFTKKMTEQDLTKANLDLLKTSPVQLQECVDGVDIRAYTLGSKVFAAEIKAKTIDFRADNNSEIVPVELPADIQKDCCKVLKILKMAYSGIDIRRNENGEYVFIEANPAPMFIHFEKQTKYPITENLIKLLTE